MGAGLLMGLVQSLIAGFAPVAKQRITQAMDKHGQDSTAMNTIFDAVLGAVSTATGTSVATMKADDKAAIAAVNTVQNNAQTFKTGGATLVVKPYDVISPAKGNNGVGNGVDPQPPGNPPVNDGPGTGPGNPGNKQTP